MVEKFSRLKGQRTQKSFYWDLWTNEWKKNNNNPPHGRLNLYMGTAAKLLYSRQRKDNQIDTMEEGIMKMSEIAEIAKSRYISYGK